MGRARAEAVTIGTTATPRRVCPMATPAGSATTEATATTARVNPRCCSSRHQIPLAPAHLSGVTSQARASRKMFMPSSPCVCEATG